MTYQRYRKTLITAVVLVAGLLCLWFLNAKVQTQTIVTPTPTASTAAKPPTPEELLKLVNEQRQKVGVAPLVIDERLNQSAQRKADDMVSNKYYGHASPIDGKQGYTYVKDSAPGLCRYASENLYTGVSKEYPSTIEGAMKGWTTSNKHYAAMTDKRYTITGFGYKDGYYVEHFCET